MDAEDIGNQLKKQKRFLRKKQKTTHKKYNSIKDRVQINLEINQGNLDPQHVFGDEYKESNIGKSIDINRKQSDLPPEPRPPQPKVSFNVEP